MSKIFTFIWETIKIAAITLLIVMPIRYYLFQPYLVRGESMEPNFHQGDYLIVDEISYRFREPQRGEVIVFEAPINNSVRYIKRIIGLPGERVIIEHNQIIIDSAGERIVLKENYLPDYIVTTGKVDLTLKDNEYFVLGDNRPNSLDSRAWGVLTRDKIIGRVWLRLWPITAISKIPQPVY